SCGAVRTAVMAMRVRAAIGRALAARGAVGPTVVTLGVRAAIGRALAAGGAVGPAVMALGVGSAIGRAFSARRAGGADVLVLDAHAVLLERRFPAWCRRSRRYRAAGRSGSASVRNNRSVMAHGIACPPSFTMSR